MHVPDDDEQFERYLKQFRPLAPSTLPTEKIGHKSSRRTITRAAYAAAVVVMLGAAMLAVFSPATRTRPSDAAEPSGEHVVNNEQLLNTRPLTVGSANALLATAPSFEDALDEIAVPSRATPLPEGKHSALAMLGKEETQL